MVEQKHEKFVMEMMLNYIKICKSAYEGVGMIPTLDLLIEDLQEKIKKI